MAGLGAGGAAGGGGPLAGLASLFTGNSLLAIAAGLIVGVAGTGTLLATGAVHVGGGATAPASSTAGLQLVACPDAGPVIGTLPQGEKVLVTGRTSDGTWLQIYYPGPAFDRAWTKAGPLQLEADASGLPVAACEAPLSPSPAPSPGPSTAVVEPSPQASPSPQPSPSPSPSPSAGPSPSPSPRPSPSPSPTPKPTPNTPPVIASLSPSTGAVSYDQGAYCPTAPKTVTFTLKASDAGGVTSATLYWRKPGATAYAAAPMTLAGGTAQSGTWRVTLDTTANGITTAGRLTYYAVAQDASAARARTPASGTAVVTVNICVNTGPTFVSGPTAGNATIYADPRNTGCGSPIGTEVSATITDIDGVKSATLVFTDQGGTVVQRPMTGYAGNLWTSSINADDDGTQGNGTVSFSVVATDSKGASTTSGTQTIQVVRCDSPARIGAGLSSPPSNQNGGYAWASCPSPVTVTFAITALDPDSPNGPLQVQVAWSIVDSDGVRRPQSGVVNGYQLKGSSYSATIPTALTSGWCDANSGFYGSGNRLTFTITTTDQFGGVTRSRPLTVSLDIYAPVTLY